jgi:hypothetical protein
VQTEIRLVLSGDSSSKSSKAGKGKGHKKKKTAANSGKSAGASSAAADDGMPLLQFDHTYLDDHHRAMLVAYLLGEPAIVRGASARGARGNGGGKVPSLPLPPGQSTDTSSTPVPSLYPSDEISAVWMNDAGAGTCHPSTLLIGLGGGALAMAIQKYLPGMNLDVVELVPGLEEIAREHFSFVKGSRCRVLEGDGLEVVRSMQRINSTCTNAFAYEHIIIDVDGKDQSASEGLSAPPQDFVTSEFLSSLRDVMAPWGVLSFNVVSRNAQVINRLGFQLAIVFGSDAVTSAASMSAAAAAAGVDASSSEHTGCSVYKIRPSTENVNVTLHVTKYSPPPSSSSLGVASSAKNGGGKASSKVGKKAGKGGVSGSAGADAAIKKQRMRHLEEWLQVAIQSLCVTICIHYM